MAFTGQGYRLDGTVVPPRPAPQPPAPQLQQSRFSLDKYENYIKYIPNIALVALLIINIVHASTSMPSNINTYLSLSLATTALLFDVKNFKNYPNDRKWLGIRLVYEVAFVLFFILGASGAVSHLAASQFYLASLLYSVIIIPPILILGVGCYYGCKAARPYFERL